MYSVQICSGLLWKHKNTPDGGILYNLTDNDGIQQLFFFLNNH